MFSTRRAGKGRLAWLVCGRPCGMRCGALLVACAAAALALPGPSTAGAPSVAALQVALRIRGFHAGAIDGLFGPETRAAVKRFQRSEGLPVDGIAGGRTRAALGRFARHRLGSRLLRRGRVGWDVAALQYLLVRCGLSVGAIDGVFGPRTHTALVRYQRRAEVPVDGVAGSVTVAALRRARGCRAIRGTVSRGVTVSRISLGGLTGRWAAAALRSAFGQPLRLRAHGRTWLVDPDALARPRIARAVRRALDMKGGQALRLGVEVERRRVRRYASIVANRACAPAVPARLVGLRSLRPRISRARPGCRVRRGVLARALIRRLRGLDRSLVAVPMKRIAPTVTRANFGPVVVIRRKSHRLYLYRSTQRVRALRVGTGRRSAPTPLGRFTIVARVRRPWWYPPSSGWAAGLDPIPPGPGNPLGTRWMGISSPGVGIHGTPDAASVGYSRSHGCVRMYPRQAEWLFRRVRIGTPVMIVRA